MSTTDRILGGSLSRRAFLSRLALVAGGSAVALACGSEATAIVPTATTAAPLSPTAKPTTAPGSTGGDSAALDSIDAGPIEFDADGEKLLGYLSRPTLPGPHPAIVVVHENRGLLPHFHDLTRRYAREGYVALAVDMLSRQGGADSFADGNAMRAALGRIPQDQVVYDGNAAVRFLQSLPYVRRDRVGATGFCFGGSIVWRMAVGNPELRAAVPFYGSAPPLEDVANLQVPVLGIYAGEDSRINAGVPALEAELMAKGKDYKFVTYPGANHAFFNDTGSRYHPQAAEAAWMEALDWFEDHLMDT
ncbi:MAG: dienelactone hydrolase family protein [Chloroflexi bacterium]|nr:dienelactone hydrolase family protein [Chloroflexota bacterium]